MRCALALSLALTIPAAFLAACGDTNDTASPGDETPDAAGEASKQDGGLDPTVGDARTDSSSDASSDAKNDTGLVAVTLGGTIVGLVASTGDAGLGNAGTGGLVLANGADELEVFGNGPFTFPTKISSGAAFNVSVATQPSNPLQACSVSGGIGTAGGAAITSVTVNCDPTTFTVGGNVTGIANGGTLTLRLNDAIDVDVTNAAGTYAFGTALASGTPYSVAVKTHPVDQKCTVANPTGLVTNAPISNANVTCIDDPAILSVNVTGFAGTTSLTLQNGADTLPINANGVTAFPTKIAVGQPYSISVSAQPTLPYQDCTVGDVGTPAAGTFNAATTVPVSCATKTFKVTGTLKGKRAPSVTLTSGTGVDITVPNNGTFEFPGTFASGTVLAVAPTLQPGTQKCFVDGGATTVANADVGVTVSCYDEVNFAGAGSPAVTDFQVPLKLTPATFDYARAQAQGEDLRFFATHGGAALAYYIEKWNPAGDSIVWVKVPAIGAAASAKVLMFAGDAALAAGSNGDNTFLFFDDFSGAALDGNKWEVRGTPNTNSAAGGLLTFRGNNNWEYARSKTPFTSGVIEADYATIGVSGAILVGNVGSDNRYTFRDNGGATATTFDPDVSGGNAYFDTTFPGTTRGPDNTQRRETISLSVNGSNNIAVSQYCNVTAAACSGARTLTSSTGAQFFVGFTSYSSDYTVVMDRIFVRKLATGTFTATIL